MSTSNLAKTTFETGPDTKLATPDVYNEPKTTPQNNLPSNPSTNSTKVADGYKPIVNKNGNLSDALKKWKDPKNNVADMVNNLRGVVSNPSELRRTVGKTVFGNILANTGYKGDIDAVVNMIGNKPSTNDIINAMGAISPNAKILIDGVEHIRNAKNLDTFFGVSSLISELTGNTELMKVLHIGSHVAMIKTIVDIALEFRIPEVIDYIIADIRNEKEQRHIRLMAVLQAAMYSNIDYIYSVIEDRKIGLGRVQSTFPNLITIILEHFRFYNASDKNGPTFSLKLVELLFRLDPNWLKYNRNGQEILTVERMGRITSDAIYALKFDERTLIPAMVAESCPPLNGIKDTMLRREHAPIVELYSLV